VLASPDMVECVARVLSTLTSSGSPHRQNPCRQPARPPHFGQWITRYQGNPNTRCLREMVPSRAGENSPAVRPPARPAQLPSSRFATLPCLRRSPSVEEARIDHAGVAVIGVSVITRFAGPASGNPTGIAEAVFIDEVAIALVVPGNRRSRRLHALPSARNWRRRPVLPSSHRRDGSL